MRLGRVLRTGLWRRTGGADETSGRTGELCAWKWLRLGLSGLGTGCPNHDFRNQPIDINGWHEWSGHEKARRPLGGAGLGNLY